MVFMFFLKDNVDYVFAIENNGIIVTGAFFRVFQACRIRRISLDLMLVVMLLRLSFAYALSYKLCVTASLSLAYTLSSYDGTSLNRQVKSRPVTSNR